MTNLRVFSSKSLVLYKDASFEFVSTFNIMTELYIFIVFTRIMVIYSIYLARWFIGLLYLPTARGITSSRISVIKLPKL